MRGWTIREYAGEEFVVSQRQVYDDSRNYLKNCGKPLDWFDSWLITYHKANCELTRYYVTTDKGY